MHRNEAESRSGLALIKGKLMTIKQIKIMFSPGDQWQVERVCERVAGWDCNEPRTIVAVLARYLVSRRPDGKDIHTEWPKAGEVMEARDGFLKLRYDWGTVVTLTKLPEGCA